MPWRRLLLQHESEALKQLRSLLVIESSDGFELLKDPENNPICSVSFDDTVPGIVVRWRRYATSNQLRFIHERILHMLQMRRVSKLLGDDTALPMVHAADQKWIVANWMPRAVAAGLKVAASKTPAAYFGRLSVDNIRSAIPAALVMRSFDDVDHARQWLRSFGA